MNDILSKPYHVAFEENDASLHNMLSWYTMEPTKWETLEAFLLDVIFVQTAAKGSLQKQLVDEVACRPAWPESYVDMNS